jgi:hypothetical protein
MRTEDEYNQMLELKNQGKNLMQISSILNISYRTLSRWINRKPKYFHNFKVNYFQVTDEHFINIIKNSYSVANALKQLNLKAAGGNYAIFYNKIKKLNLDISHFTGQGYLKEKTHNWSKQISNDSLFTANSNHQTCVIRKRIIKDKLIPYTCAACQNTGIWLNNVLSLHLDHINGIRDDNRLENLRFLCPNCHAQTPTYCGKNKKKKIIGIERLELSLH